VDITRALFAGETVTHRGRVTVVEARLYSRPDRPVPLFGAAVSEETAGWVGSWADGLLTVGGDPEDVRRRIAAFRDNGGYGKPVHVQAAVGWAPTIDEAVTSAFDQWAPCVVGGEASWDLRRPADFDTVGKLVTPQRVREAVLVAADPGPIIAMIGALADLGVSAIHLHQVGTAQEAFVEMAGRHILPNFA
jgi:alkanesulfonate monooxygenase SsuD/methylene tetrahydromethanopterin reductase-like flavin-dependent oxidoreductase (luciferase family)